MQLPGRFLCWKTCDVKKKTSNSGDPNSETAQLLFLKKHDSRRILHMLQRRFRSEVNLLVLNLRRAFSGMIHNRHHIRNVIIPATPFPTHPATLRLAPHQFRICRFGSGVQSACRLTGSIILCLAGDSSPWTDPPF